HFPAPAVLKIDVEGAELVVLGGAIRVLSQFRPKVYCEVTGRTRDEATDLLQRLGYETFDGESFGTDQPREVVSGTTNLVAVPLCDRELQRNGS
ncbi:MAG: FkbM family methyltransferase, partial [Thiohalomonadaceae bacterium]